MPFDRGRMAMAGLLTDSQEITEAACSVYAKEDLNTFRSLEKRVADARVHALGSYVGAFLLTALGIIVAAMGEHKTGIPAVAAFGLPTLAGLAFLALFYFRLRGARRAHATYHPRTRIRSIRTGLLPLLAIRGRYGLYTCDQSSMLSPTTLTFPSQEAAERLEHVLNNHRELVSSMPGVLDSERVVDLPMEDGTAQPLFAEEGKLYGVYEEAKEIIAGLETSSVDARILEMTPEQLRQLVACDEEASGIWDESPHMALEEPPEEDGLTGLVRRLEGEVEAAGDADSVRSKVDAFLTAFLEEIRKDLDKLDASRQLSLGVLLQSYSRDLEKLTAMASFNCYCPTCNASFVEESAAGAWRHEACEFPLPNRATRMRPVPGTNAWECPICSERTERPLPIHRLFDELVAPAMDRLLQENKVKREEVYLEAGQRNREWMERAEREARSVADTAKRDAGNIQMRIRDVATEISAARASIDLLMSEIGTVEALRGTRLMEIARDVQSTVREIAEYRETTNAAFTDTMDRIEDDATAALKQLASVARIENEARMRLMQQTATNLKTVADNTAEAVAVNKENLAANKEAADSAKEGNALMAVLVDRSKGFKRKNRFLGVVGGESDYDRQRRRYT